MNISLYELIKQKAKEKGGSLKIICDWDEVLKPLNPFVWHNLIKENNWCEGEANSFEEYFSDFWNNASFEYHERGQKTTNTRNKVIEEYRKNPEVFQKKVREPFFKISKSSNFYDRSPWLSMAEELLLALKEDLINELVIISATPDKDWRKRKKFAKTFGKFPRTSINLIPYQAPSLFRWEWVRENHPDFDLFIDDSNLYVEKIKELFPNKCYALPNLTVNVSPVLKNKQNVYFVKQKVNMTLRDQHFALGALEYRANKLNQGIKELKVNRSESKPNPSVPIWLIAFPIISWILALLVWVLVWKRKIQPSRE